MIRLKNNTGGYYSLNLKDFQSMKMDRTFVFNTPGMELNIPDDYAASIPSDPYAFAAYKAGIFTVVNDQEKFNKMLVDAGVASPEETKVIQASIVPDGMLLAALKDGKLSKVQEYINSPNLERLVQLAVDNAQSISREKIDAIEKATGLAITVENE